MNGTLYQFGDPQADTRRFIEPEEIVDLAARCHALGNLFDHFAAVDDQGAGLVRNELLRAIRELSTRSVTVLS